jgi:hypothetical protein
MITIDTIRTFNDAYPSISVETIEALMLRGLFHWSEQYWRFGDDSNGSTRRLDGKRWIRADNSGRDWHKLVGLSDVVRHDRRYVMFAVEGSKDALAAAELVHRIGVLDQVGIVCALGSGYRPLMSEIQQLRGRHVLVIGDNDAAGQRTAEIVSRALEQGGSDHHVWNWSPWLNSGSDVKDVYDAVALLDSWAGGRAFPGAGFFEQAEMQNSASCTHNFSPSSLPSQSSTIHLFNGSTTETHGISAEEKLGIVAPFILTKRGTGNAMSFQLARAIKNNNFPIMDIEKIFHLWFEKSRPLLPPHADEGKSLETFFRQLKRVRFTNSGLEAACQRARTDDKLFRAVPPSGEITGS